MSFIGRNRIEISKETMREILEAWLNHHWRDGPARPASVPPDKRIEVPGCGWDKIGNTFFLYVETQEPKK